ncbi:MAG: tetratricopeptide repeat protein [Candidatus Omnitrophica bacterium]|nr:tetratricopeptide repeat protein [Candidatus Omnitrophota bacterium]
MARIKSKNNLKLLLLVAYSFFFCLQESGFAQINAANSPQQKRLIQEQKNILAHFSMGVIYDNENNRSLAIKEYDRALEKEANNPYILTKKGIDLLIEADADSALACLEKAVALSDKDQYSLFVLSTAYALLHQLDKAIEGYLKILEVDPLNTKALKALGDIYIVEGNYEKALNKYSKLHEITGDSNNFLEISVLYEKTGQTDKAIENLQKQDLSRNVPALVVLGALYFKNGNFKKAISIYNDILKIDPFNIEALQGLARIYVKQKNIDKAYTLYDQIISNNTQETAVALSYAIFCLEQNNLEKGFSLLEEISLTGQEKIYIVVGYLYLLYNKPEQAIQSLSKAIVKNERNALCYYLLAVAHDLQGQDLLCYKSLRKALGYKQGFHEAYNYLGVKLLQSKNNLKEAEHLFKKAISLEPDNYNYLDNLGSVYLEQERFKEAKKIFERALLIEKNVEGFDHLAESYYLLGQTKEAIKIWQKVIDLEPNRKDIKIKIDKAVNSTKKGKRTK